MTMHAKIFKNAIFVFLYANSSRSMSSNNEFAVDVSSPQEYFFSKSEILLLFVIFHENIISFTSAHSMLSVSESMENHVAKIYLS